MNLQEMQALFIADDLINKLTKITDKEAARGNSRQYIRYDISEVPDLATASQSFITDSINEQIGRIIEAEVNTVGLPVIRQVILLRHVNKLHLVYNVVSRKIMADCALETVKKRLTHLHSKYNDSRNPGEPYVIDIVLPQDVNEYSGLVEEKIAKPMGFDFILLRMGGFEDIGRLLFTPKGETYTLLPVYLKKVRALVMSLIEEGMEVGTIPIDNIRDLELVNSFINTNAGYERLKHTPARGYTVNASIGNDRDCLEIELILVNKEDRDLYLAEMKEAEEAKKALSDEEIKAKDEDKIRSAEKKAAKEKSQAEATKEKEFKEAEYSREREKKIRGKSKDLKPKVGSLLSKKPSSVSYSDSTRTVKAKPKKTKKVTVKK